MCPTTTDHRDERRILRVTELERQSVAVSREWYVLNLANFGIICEWCGPTGYDKKTVGRLTGTFDRYGNILTLTRLGGELPGICVGKKGE
jgi:hypothetical protein